MTSKPFPTSMTAEFDKRLSELQRRKVPANNADYYEMAREYFEGLRSGEIKPDMPPELKMKDSR